MTEEGIDSDSDSFYSDFESYFPPRKFAVLASQEAISVCNENGREQQQQVEDCATSYILIAETCTILVANHYEHNRWSITSLSLAFPPSLSLSLSFNLLAFLQQPDPSQSTKSSQQSGQVSKRVSSYLVAWRAIKAPSYLKRTINQIQQDNSTSSYFFLSFIICF